MHRKKTKPLEAQRPITIVNKITEEFVFIIFLICKLYNKPLYNMRTNSYLK